MKESPRERFLKAFKPYYEIRHYVGIAADEVKRLALTIVTAGDMTVADCMKSLTVFRAGAVRCSHSKS